MTIDLSFTRDPLWREERERQWRTIGRSLSTDLDKRAVEEVGYYFLNGEFLDGGSFDGPACFTWFPLQTNEGWDYVLQHIVKQQEVFEEKFYRSLDSLETHAISPETELAMWDYFHPKEFQSKVRSRVPVGRDGTHVEIEVNPYLFLSRIVTGFDGYISFASYGEWPKWCQRQDYFFSALPYFSFDTDKKYKKRDLAFRCFRKFHLFFATLYWPERWAELEDPKRHREGFFAQFRERIEAMADLPESIAELWEKAKTGELRKEYE